MNTYKITYTEKLVHTFYIEADSIEDAEDTFNNFVDHGEVDFSDGELVDSDIMIEESKEEI